MQCKTLFMRIDPFFRAPQHTWKDWASRAAREWTPLEGTHIKKKTLNLSNYYSKDQDLLFLYFLCTVCVPPEHCTSSQTCLQQPNHRRCFSSCLSSHPRCNVPFLLNWLGETDTIWCRFHHSWFLLHANIVLLVARWSSAVQTHRKRYITREDLHRGIYAKLPCLAHYFLWAHLS